MMRDFGARKVMNIIDYILAMIIIMNCNTVFEKSVNINFHLQEAGCVLVYVAVFMSIVLFGLDQSTVFKCFKWIRVMIWYIPVAVLYFIARYGIMAKGIYIRLFLIFFPGILLYVYLERKPRQMNLYKAISDIMVIEGGLSALIWIFSNIIGILHANGSILVNWGGERLYESFFDLQYQIAWQSIKIFGLTGYRNIGFFCEAPMLSLMLTFALIYELFFRNIDKSNKKPRFEIVNGKIFINKGYIPSVKIIILVLSNITTFSATGYILMIVAFILKFAQNGKKKGLNIIKKLAFPVIIVSAGVLIYIVWNQKADSAQWLTRFDDYIVGILAWRSNKICGVGFGNMEALIPYMSAFRSSNTGISSGFFTVLAQGGILLTIIYLIPLVGSILSASTQKDRNMCAFMILSMVEFVVTYFPYTFFMLLILAYGYMVIDSAPQSSAKTIVVRKTLLNR